VPSTESYYWAHIKHLTNKMLVTNKIDNIINWSTMNTARKCDLPLFTNSMSPV